MWPHRTGQQGWAAGSHGSPKCCQEQNIGTATHRCVVAFKTTLGVHLCFVSFRLRTCRQIRNKTPSAQRRLSSVPDDRFPLLPHTPPLIWFPQNMPVGGGDRRTQQAGGEPAPAALPAELLYYAQAQRDLIGNLRASRAVSPGQEKAGGGFECRHQTLARLLR